MRGNGWCVAWLWLLMLTPSLAAAEGADTFRTKFDREVAPGQGVLVCTRVEKPPTIDGDVDKDPVWSACGRTRGAWVQLASKDPTGRQTVVYSCYDKDTIYFAFVCEETELQNVRMDGSIGIGQFLGSDDCVEVTLEVGGLHGDGQVYSFRANSRGCVSGWGGTGIPTAPGGGEVMKEWHVPACKYAGKLGPNRWMVELAIPFAELKRRPRDKSLATPSRGDVLGLKLARYGSVQQDAKNRMISTWNTRIVYPYMHICGSNGLLYFQNANALLDGEITQVGGKSAWTAMGFVTTRPAGGAALGEGATLSQSVAVHPQSLYSISLEVDGKALPDVLLDGKAIVLKDGKGTFWTAAKGDKLDMTLRAAGHAVTIKKVLVQYQPGEEPPGPYCLTNNYRTSERNISSSMSDAPEGKYRYVKIDYAGRVTQDTNPSLNVNYGYDWAYDHNLRVEDVGGKEGWISFAKGSIVGQHKPVFWNPVNPADPACWGRLPRVVDVDLGQEYFVSGVDILWPGPNMINVEIWGKAREADEWTLLDMSEGEYVPPQNRRPRRGYDSVRGLDSVVRFVRWRVSQPSGDWSFPQMDGVQEFRIWGLPKGQRSGIKPFTPWVTAKRVAPEKARTDVLDEARPLIIPRPRSMAIADGWFALDKSTRIVAEDHPEARRIARQIHQEVLDRWQIDLAMDVQGKASTPGENVIYLGLPGLDEGVNKFAAAEDVAVETAKPQAYRLKVTPKRVIVVGDDVEGLYYGVQSLMMAMQWRNFAGGGSPQVRCMKVVDSPGSVLERGIYQRRPYPVMLTFIESDADRIKRICQLLSRYKYNVVYLGPNWAAPLASGPRMSPWAKRLLPKICQEVRQEYHLELRPAIQYEEGEGGNYWNDLSADAPDLREHDPDENPRELGQSANLCPLDERTYQRHFAKIDEILDDFGHPSKVWMFGQAYTSVQAGARWAQCRRCQKSGKTPEELYEYYIARIAEHLQTRQTKGLFRSPWLRYGGPRDPKDRRLISIDPQRLPAGLEFDLPDPTQGPYFAYNNDAYRQYIKEHFKPAATANGPPTWPSGERYLQDGPQSETEILASLSGISTAAWGETGGGSSLADVIESMWYAPDARPAGRLDDAASSEYVYSWWFGHDHPAWRAGERPKFFPVDLRSFVNHTSHATGAETLEPGRPPEIDLRYLPTGLQTLAGVSFNIIDPADNGGKAVLMLGRPAPGTPANIASAISEGTAPIPVGRKLASIAFLRKRWHCRLEEMSFEETWLRPTCRVVYDDGSWLVADCFLYFHAPLFFDEWNNDSGAVRPQYRLGWQGNCPGGKTVTLNVAEWVNPYPDKTIKHIEFFTPDSEDAHGKRVSDMMEAIVAVTGVEPVARDLAFWKGRADASPLLAPRRANPAGTEIRLARELRQAGDGKWAGALMAGSGQVQYTLAPIGRAGVDRGWNAIHDMAYCNVDFSDFGVEMTLDKPLAMGRIELRGPVSFGAHWGSYSSRTKKVDVTVEVSEDGTAWRSAGMMKGLSADADFIPLDLGGKTLKAIRMTGSARAYRRDYHPVQFQGDVFWRNVPHWNPSFTWRLFAPDASTLPASK